MRLPENHSGARSDSHLVELWLCGRPEETQKTYRRDAQSFLDSLPKSLPETTVADVIAWVKTLKGSEGYKGRRVIAVKSLLSFAEKTGYCVFNVGMALRTPKRRQTLHERIVERDTVQGMIAASEEGRDRILVKFLYASACRVSEVVRLNWNDLGCGVVALHGKGKSRTVPVPETILVDVRQLRWSQDNDNAPIFKSFRGRRLGVRDVQRIVKKAREGVTVKQVSPHWMRHAHATHSLDKGAPIHKLQRQLGHENVSTTSVYLHVRGGEGTSEYLDL